MYYPEHAAIPLSHAFKIEFDNHATKLISDIISAIFLNHNGSIKSSY
jgi:hypothetical protein